MQTEKTIYDEMFNSSKSTLKDTSYNKNGDSYMTESQIEVVAFDLSKDKVAQRLRVQASPLSCDALYRSDSSEWFLIEFKDGHLNNNDIFEVLRKFFESMLILTQKLNQTIEFTRKNLIFIFVVNIEDDRDNSDKKKNDRFGFLHQLYSLGHRHEILPFTYLSEALLEIQADGKDKFNVCYFGDSYVNDANGNPSIKEGLYVKKALICSKTQFENYFVAKYSKKS